MRRISGIIGLFLAICVPVAAAESSLAERLPAVLAGHAGKVAVAVKHLDTGEEFHHHAGEVMPTASLIKLAVLVAAYRQADEGKLDLSQPLALREEDKVPGSGVLTPHFSAGTQLSVRDALRLMIAFSDNTATNLVLDQIGLPTTTETMERLGLANTKLHAKVYRAETSIFPERSKQYGLGSTTPAEMVRLLEQIHRREAAAAASCDAMLEHLKACQDRDLLARELPSGTRLAHKTGAVTSVRTAAGIILSPQGPLAVCVMTAENQDKRWTRDNAAQVLCGRVARLVYDHFNPPGLGSPPSEPGPLRLGAAGSLVESLQRTLNARLEPAPELNIDGDFGPATRQAVIRFQQQSHLVPSGEVGPETWAALGTLITQDEPVPAPEFVNTQNLPRQPTEDLDAPPAVTCRAWAIADGATGELKWGWNERQKLDIASTTKLLTAYVVLELADQDARVLDEVVTISQRADDTPGSTAGVRVGEKLSVGELLYGLLIPSGNDAAIALAEHFGDRFAPAASDAAPQDPLALFVEQMNHTAAGLGLTDTHVRNPHGLTESGHQSTAADLIRLTHAARQLPHFSQYVGARQRGSTVTGPGGYTRNVLWRTTNRLLGIEGYDGVKTGTTTAAGACLVGSGRRDDRELIVVVLGSTSSDARYVDARNLFRWAWKQPQ